MTLEKYTVGVGDRFAHQAEAQLQACVQLAADGIEVVPVWNKSNREHSFIGSEPQSVYDAAKAAVSNANKGLAVVNDRLPEMIDEVKTGTEALAGLAEDVELIKSLAGLNAERSKQGFRGLATYADDLQKALIERSEGKGVIVMKEKLIGKKLEEVESEEELSLIHYSEPTRPERISYAVFCLEKK